MLVLQHPELDEDLPPWLETAPDTEEESREAESYHLPFDEEDDTDSFTIVEEPAEGDPQTDDPANQRERV